MVAQTIINIDKWTSFCFKDQVCVTWHCPKNCDGPAVYLLPHVLPTVAVFIDVLILQKSRGYSYIHSWQKGSSPCWITSCNTWWVPRWARLKWRISASLTSSLSSSFPISAPSIWIWGIVWTLHKHSFFFFLPLMNVYFLPWAVMRKISAQQSQRMAALTPPPSSPKHSGYWRR